jgi:adenylate cyclase
MTGEDYLEALSTPVLHVQGADWTVTYANSAAQVWLGVKVGQALQAVLPNLDRAKALGRLQKGRGFSLTQKTHTALSLSASYQFKLMSDGQSVMIEGRDDSAMDEAQGMINAYSQMVERQKVEIEAEKAHVEKLLLNILPRKTLEDLRLLGRSEPEHFPDVSVLFLDFVGFTAISQQLSPQTLFAELNDMFTAFDTIVAQQGCERIKTIGDAYLAVSGMPEPRPDHARQIVDVALRIRDYLLERNTTHEQTWKCRIGIHSGAVIAGIVGQVKYIYDIFGDGVNTAARMESHSEPMCINISKSTHLKISDTFVCETRGSMPVKGKGDQEMFFVLGRID